MEDETGRYGMEAKAAGNLDVEISNEELRTALLQKVSGTYPPGAAFPKKTVCQSGGFS
jgi:hypothetical protein